MSKAWIPFREAPRTQSLFGNSYPQALRRLRNLPGEEGSSGAELLAPGGKCSPRPP
jgi:hypothetical protein